MNERIRKLADAVLFEGYILYPYRASALKNKRRFDLGVVVPEGSPNDESNFFRLEIPVDGTSPEIRITLRFLHLCDRRVEEFDGREFRAVEILKIDDAIYQSWQEAVAVSVELQFKDYRLQKGISSNTGQFSENGDGSLELSWPGGESEETIEGADGELKGRVIRCTNSIAASVSAVFNKPKLSITVKNSTSVSLENATRDEILLSSLVAAHLILETENSAFVSLLEPPAEFEEVAQSCVNKGVFPVLVGPKDSRNCVFASPVILYDYPEIALESAGDMFDGGEIDELLTLRIMTMTEDEKREMASVDPRAAAILERTEGLSDEQLLGLHGRFSDAKPPFKRGDKVRLKPRAGGDLFDMFLVGQTAVVEGVEIDFENRVHLAVVLDNDPGKDLGMDRMPGHRFFFAVDEVESL